MFRVVSMVVGEISTNCYFMINTDQQKAVVIDPGDYADQIENYFKENQIQPAAILLTHGHFDHMMAAGALRDKFQIPVYACEKEREVLNHARINLSEQFLGRTVELDADHYVTEGQVLELAGAKFQVIETPGHTQGGCCYYMESRGILFSGDTLFYGCVGRCDHPGGSFEMLQDSIKKKLFHLPEDTIVYPGHGDPTTIGFEKENNPYVG